RLHSHFFFVRGGRIHLAVSQAPPPFRRNLRQNERHAYPPVAAHARGVPGQPWSRFPLRRVLFPCVARSSPRHSAAPHLAGRRVGAGRRCRRVGGFHHRRRFVLRPTVGRVAGRGGHRRRTGAL